MTGMTEALLMSQNREEDTMGAGDGWMELHDQILQEQLLRWFQTGVCVSTVHVCQLLVMFL